MTIYAAITDGHGKAGPLPDTFTPWINCRNIDEPEKLEEVRLMIAGKWIRENGIKENRQPRTFTVFTYDSETPLHPNGRPMVVKTVTYQAWPDEKPRL